MSESLRISGSKSSTESLLLSYLSKKSLKSAKVPQKTILQLPSEKGVLKLLITTVFKSATTDERSRFTNNVETGILARRIFA
ncbi:unnamed protein product [Acanthoscelides obtectus]|uniref:Uncharacterized protein n=1 Tax=Acanthoscelides obtectus TaxID=200917 RepID=A0A9P0L611_ACAOB|nr:unnamed protein product [Acanthoscelides obtectus]CAK1667886.1 hypothetical protein AOBTE_LOCUS26090 [Acanthoscelides obtectus]